MKEFQEALGVAKIKINKFDPTKSRPVYCSLGTMDVKKFSSVLLERLGVNILKYPKLVEAAHDHAAMEDLLGGFAEEEEKSPIVIPAGYEDYILNVDLSAGSKEEAFFVSTKKDELVSRINGSTYISICNIPKGEVYSIARHVIREYRPRGAPGIIQQVNRQTDEVENIFNTYVPPEWEKWRRENPREWDRLPSKPPVLVIKLLKHLIPIEEERKYLYAWIYSSITSRAYVYLILCGAPGAGKNRLNLLLSALHGTGNFSNGKRSVLTERFNGQLDKRTLTWFDELKYDSEMENVMKEIQNDYLSIEKKGIDATSSTRIHPSMVISNNKPRDNFIAFDARKFAPLVVGDRDLKHSMTDEEIDTFSRKVDLKTQDDGGKCGFDVKYIAQVAKWILKVGQANLKRYHNLEYRGPMFWTLAHTSMTKWQKKAVSVVTDHAPGARAGWDPNEGAFLWSAVEGKLLKRGSTDKSITFPDYSSVKAFFDIFRDGRGVKAFNTKIVPGKNIMGDFWIYPLTDKVDIITEATIAEQREKGSKDEEREEFDL